MTFQIKIIGSSSATPTIDRNQSGQLIQIQSYHFLVDCGEGTQIQFLKYKIRHTKIDAIFISHLHGDHYFGLIGLLSTMHLQGRERPLWIYGPNGLQEIITLQSKLSAMIFSYELRFVAVEDMDSILFENDELAVEKIPLNHRISCTGFLFREKPKKHRILKDKLSANIKIADIIQLKEGKDIYDQQGNILIKNEEVTLSPKKSRSYAYCSDTKYTESIIDYIREVDLLYHESTFLSDHEQRADETFHSTARQAAMIAQKANVHRLLLGHFSSRYDKLDAFLEEAQTVFPNTSLAVDGMSFSIEE